MAEKRYARLNDTPEIIPANALNGSPFTLPTVSAILALPAVPTATGKNGSFELFAGSFAITLLDATNEDGTPVVLEATVAFRRGARNATEAAILAKVKGEQLNAKDKREQTAARARINEIAAAKGDALESYTRGIQDVGKIADAVSQAKAALAQVASVLPSAPALPAASVVHVPEVVK